jgi:hypothetical protein
VKQPVVLSGVKLQFHTLRKGNKLFMSVKEAFVAILVLARECVTEDGNRKHIKRSFKICTLQQIS